MVVKDWVQWAGKQGEPVIYAKRQHLEILSRLVAEFPPDLYHYEGGYEGMGTQRPLFAIVRHRLLAREWGRSTVLDVTNSLGTGRWQWYKLLEFQGAEWW